MILSSKEKKYLEKRIRGIIKREVSWRHDTSKGIVILGESQAAKEIVEYLVSK